MGAGGFGLTGARLARAASNAAMTSSTVASRFSSVSCSGVKWNRVTGVAVAGRRAAIESGLPSVGAVQDFFDEYSGVPRVAFDSNCYPK